MAKPSNTEEYITWWNKRFSPKIDQITKKQYEYVRMLLKDTFKNSTAWNNWKNELYDCDALYRQKHGYKLLMNSPDDIVLDEKDWDKFILKVWRRNRVEHENWNNITSAEVLDTNWITPMNWYEKINDIVRTTIVVKYLDGVEFLIDKMCAYFRNNGYECTPDWEAREEGYYAVHLNVKGDYELLLGLITTIKKISVEIQVTTQMKDVIKELMHKYYEERRRQSEEPGKKWQWDFRSKEFAPNYLGHIIHYVDGAIVEIRDKGETNGRQ